MCFFHAPHLSCQRKETKARIAFWEHSLQDIKYVELEKAHDFIFFPFLHYFLSSSANNWERKPSEDIEATSRDRLRSAWNYWDQPYCSNHFFVKKQLGALKTKRNEASIMSKSFPVRFLSFKVTTRLKARLVSFSNPRRVRSKEVFSKTCTDHTFLCLFTHQIILEFGRGHNNFLQTKKRPRGHAIFFFCYASS